MDIIAEESRLLARALCLLRSLFVSPMKLYTLQDRLEFFGVLFGIFCTYCAHLCTGPFFDGCETGKQYLCFARNEFLADHQSCPRCPDKNLGWIGLIVQQEPCSTLAHLLSG